MKKLFLLVLFGLTLNCVTVQRAAAQDPVTAAIKAAITKVIKAIDLQIQRIQTQTIWLQNAQKVIENTMSKLHLDEITDWVQKQKDLYGEYYDELWKVKAIIKYYHRIKDISTKQAAILTEYKRAWNLVQNDKNFTAPELNYMKDVYGGILDATAKNIDQLFVVINAFNTQMTDAKRLEIINKAAADTDQTYGDLKQFNTQNALLSLSRTKDQDETATIKKLYGL